MARITPPGGSASSASVSATPLGYVNLAMEQTVTAGTEHHIDFTGVVPVLGEDYWGAPGSAVDLALTINGSGDVVRPDDDCTYDIRTSVTVTPHAADAGKLVGLACNGSDNGANAWFPMKSGGAMSFMSLNWVDRVYDGDGPQTVVVTLDASALTEDATVTCRMVITKR